MVRIVTNFVVLTAMILSLGACMDLTKVCGSPFSSKAEVENFSRDWVPTSGGDVSVPLNYDRGTIAVGKSSSASQPTTAGPVSLTQTDNHELESVSSELNFPNLSILDISVDGHSAAHLKFENINGQPSVTFTAPPMPAGNHMVVLYLDHGTLYPGDLRYVASPEIQAISPGQVYSGDELTLSGTDFPESPDVFIGTERVKVTRQDSSSLTVIAPHLDPAHYEIVLRDPAHPGIEGKKDVEIIRRPSGPPTPPQLPTGLLVIGPSHFVEGSSAAYTPAYLYADGSTQAIDPALVTWESSDPAVASVSSSGTVRGVASGMAGIKAVYNGFSGEMLISIDAAPLVAESLEIQGSGTVTIGSPRTFSLVVHYSDSSQSIVDPLAAAWSSGDPTVATISNAGLVTGIKAGSVTFHVNYLALSASFTTTVLNTPSVSLNDPNSKGNITLMRCGAAKQRTYQATALLWDGTDVTSSPDTVWTSSDPAMVTVSQSGLISAQDVYLPAPDATVTVRYTDPVTGLVSQNSYVGIIVMNCLVF